MVNGFKTERYVWRPEFLTIHDGVKQVDLSGICEGIHKNENGNNIRANGDKIMQNSALTPSWTVRIIR